MDADAYDALMRRLDALDAKFSTSTTRLEQAVDKLSTIMIDLAATTDKLEDQLLRFIASQQETNARLALTLDAIKDLLRQRRNGNANGGSHA